MFFSSLTLFFWLPYLSPLHHCFNNQTIHSKSDCLLRRRGSEEVVNREFRSSQLGVEKAEIISVMMIILSRFWFMLVKLAQWLGYRFRDFWLMQFFCFVSSLICVLFLAPSCFIVIRLILSYISPYASSYFTLLCPIFLLTLPHFSPFSNFRIPHCRLRSMSRQSRV